MDQDSKELATLAKLGIGALRRGAPVSQKRRQQIWASTSIPPPSTPTNPSNLACSPWLIYSVRCSNFGARRVPCLVRIQLSTQEGVRTLIATLPLETLDTLGLFRGISTHPSSNKYCICINKKKSKDMGAATHGRLLQCSPR